MLSRSAPEFVVKLFTLEVSEIADGTVQIISVAREPGWRTKLAVHSDDERVDPVGACVGLRGQRVKNIVRELNNEKVDIIHWSPNIDEFVAEALKPAELREIEVHKEEKRIQVWVAEDQLSLAIGKRGQNARLASRLTGWQIDIDAKEVETLTFDDQVADAVSALTAHRHHRRACPNISEQRLPLRGGLETNRSRRSRGYPRFGRKRSHHRRRHRRSPRRGSHRNPCHC